MKTCIRCGGTKEDTDFYYRNEKFSSWCIDCCRTYDKEYRNKQTPKSKIKCNLCGIKIGPEFMEDKPYKLKIYRADRTLCKTCHDELLDMNSINKNEYFRRRSYLFVKG